MLLHQKTCIGGIFYLWVIGSLGLLSNPENGEIGLLALKLLIYEGED
jgi:hypothetical protein